MKDNYRFIGPFYDVLASVYSARAIEKCKLAMLTTDHLRPGDRVLFAGAGHGADAIYAARMDARVTVLDSSGAMLRRFQARLANSPGRFRYPIRRICGDVLAHAETESYDMVVANFFLNVFSEAQMVRILRHLISLTQPGGRVVVGDFTDAGGCPFSAAFRKMYWYVAATVFWAAADNALHRIYPYEQYLTDHGLTLDDRRVFKLLNSSCYCSVVARKDSGSR